MVTKREAIDRAIACVNKDHTHMNEVYGCPDPDCGCGTGWGTELRVDCPECGKFHFSIDSTEGDDINIQEYEVDDPVRFERGPSEPLDYYWASGGGPTPDTSEECGMAEEQA